MDARGKVFETVDSFADNEPDWGGVDKAKLPRECFADPGEPDKKSTWRYPWKWVQGGSGSDEDGIYASGTIRPHRGGINAAWGAAKGAHTGKKNLELVKKLAAIRKRYGLADGKDGGQLDLGPGLPAGAGPVHSHEIHPNPPPWEDVDEDALPDAAFADPAKRLYPHHHVEGAAQRDGEGRCADGPSTSAQGRPEPGRTGGKMYLHPVGAKCAWMKAIEDGASEGVIQHLATHAFNLATPEYTTPQGVLGSGSHETGAPQFGPGGKSAAKICHKDAVLADGSAVAPFSLEAPEVATGAGYIEGYAAIFGNVDSQGEIIRKGAFSKTIRERVPAGKVKLMTLHLSKGGATQQVVGTVTQAREDDRGLWIHAEFASDPDSQGARAKAAEGHVRGLSIGYVPLSKMEILVDGEVAMELKEIKLLEVTLTPFPANELAEVTSAKSLDLPRSKQPLALLRDGNSSQPAIPHGAGPATADWGNAIARRRLALARLGMED